MSFKQERLFDFGFAFAQDDSPVIRVTLSGASAQSKDLSVLLVRMALGRGEKRIIP